MRNLDAWAASGTVLSYVAVRGEADLAALHRQAMAEGKRLALPSVERDKRRIVPRLVVDLDAMNPGSYGIPEPTHGRALNPEEIDLVLVPGLAFDRRGYRLGYGGGYYDGFLPRLSPGAAAVGIAYAEQIVNTLPAADHDRPLGMIITDREVLIP